MSLSMLLCVYYSLSETVHDWERDLKQTALMAPRPTTAYRLHLIDGISM